MIHFTPTELQTGEPRIDAMTTAGFALGFAITSIWIPHLEVLTIVWKNVFQNLAIGFSIIASILSINKSLEISKRIAKWFTSFKK